MNITPFYAAILALLFFALSVRTLRLRRKLQIVIGDAGNPHMLRAMRVHANFAEYAPFTLLLAFMLELQGGALPPCTRTMHLPACGQDFACTRRKQGIGKLQIPSIWHGHDFHSPYGFSCLPACFLCGASYQLTHRIRRLFQALTLFVRHLNSGGSDGKPGAPKSKTWATGHLTWGSEYRFLEVHVPCII